MNQMEFEKFQGILGEILQTDPLDIQLGRSLVGHYGADSLAVFQIMLSLEAEFGILIDVQETESWNTVDDVWNFLHPDRNGAEE